jgi:hypothetical protein
MQKHIMIMGGPRAGTCWLPELIRLNVVPAPDVRHEGFHGDLDKMLQEWANPSPTVHRGGGFGHDGGQDPRTVSGRHLALCSS